jgi:tetratricopeptide (TPR) repeat protein
LGDDRTAEVTVSGLPDAMVREAQLLQRLDRVPEAIEAYERVLARWPELANCWFNLGVLQRKARQLTASLASYQQALDHGISEPEEVHLNRSVIYADYLRQDERAELELKAALAVNPAYRPALLNLANLYEDLGRRDDACALYERILALDPRCFEALARYANLHPIPVADDRLTRQLRVALAQPSASATERASLGFALGRLLDGSGEYETAFDAYVAANRDSRASAAPRIVSYDRQRQEQLVDRLMQTFAVRPPDGIVDASKPPPIFICGMFRSGSTLAEQLLAGHPGVAAGGELDFLPRHVAGELAPFPESMASISPQQIKSLATRYRDELAQLFPGATYVTDKRPDNFLYIGLIKSLFPDARIVHTTRNPLDNCLSIFFLHLDHGMSYALDLMDTGHYFREYRRLMTHWQRLFGADIFDFNYDAFVREPNQTATQLFTFLGLEWEDRYLAASRSGRAIKTASVWQVREPLHRRSSGRARHYARQLVGLREYLAELLAADPTAAER